MFEAYSALNRSCNATVKAEVTRFITLTNQSRASILRCRPTRDQPCLIGQRITPALTVALQDLFKAVYVIIITHIAIISMIIMGSHNNIILKSFRTFSTIHLECS